MATAMFRTTTARTVLRSLQTTPRASIPNAALRATLKTSARSFKTSPVLSLAIRPTLQKSLVRYQSQFVAVADKDAEARLGKEKVAAHPDLVSADSSIHPVQGEIGLEEKENDVDMMAGIRSDFVRRPGYLVG